MSVIATMSTSVISLEKENEALRLKVQELERKAMRQGVKVQERQSSTKMQRPCLSTRDMLHDSKDQQGSRIEGRCGLGAS